MIKSYKFHMYPTKKQEVKLHKTLDTCRNLYNNSLEERIRAYELKEFTIPQIIKKHGLLSKSIIKLREKDNYVSQANGLTKLKIEYQEYNNVFSQVLQDVLKRLDKAYQNFFRRVKNKENPGFPRFKSRNRYDSFAYPQKGFKIKDNVIELSKIGLIRIFQHRDIEGIIKTCTIKRDIDHWYVTIVSEMDSQIEQVPIINKVGIDVGLKSLVSLSNGERIDSPKILINSEKKLTKEQRRLSRKKFKHIEVIDKRIHKQKKLKIPSKNRDKQRTKVAKLHRKIRNQRKDFNHKLSRELVNTFDLIVYEKLNIQSMLQSDSTHTIRNRNISDVAWYQLQTFTSYKAEWAGKKVMFVNPKNTSQKCSNCGIIVKKDLSVRSHNCICGLSIDRDLNAAINILNRGMKNIPTDCGEFKPMEIKLNEVGSLVL